MFLSEGKREGNMVWVNPMAGGEHACLPGRDQKATEALSKQVVIEHERNLGYDLTSMELHSGELRLIEVKGLGRHRGALSGGCNAC
jgi:hypothetical protein